MRRDTVGILVGIIGVCLGVASYWIALESGMTLMSSPEAPWWQTYLPGVVGMALMVLGIHWMSAYKDRTVEAE